MRLLVDAVPLLVRSAGVKNYLYHWILHLRRLLGDDGVRLFPFIDRLPDLDHEHSILDSPGTLARQGLLFVLNRVPNHAVDILESAADIFHATKLLYPPRRPLLTATIHDMTCWLMPEFHRTANVAAEKRFAELIWKQAAGLIAVSENTRHDAVHILGLDPERIRVIYPGVPEAYFSAAATAPPTKPYALYVGTVEPRKNLDCLLDAWQALPVSTREQYDLVLAGPEGWRSEQTIARLRTPSPGIRYLGYIPETDLPGLTAGATVFVYPSLYEGFGFPVVQAMAAGVPVITSNIASLPEVTGGAARLIDPRSQHELCAALNELLTSRSQREGLSRAGRQHARRFRWEHCALQSAEFFRDVLSRLH